MRHCERKHKSLYQRRKGKRQKPKQEKKMQERHAVKSKKFRKQIFT